MITLHLVVALAGWLPSAQAIRVDFTPASISCDKNQSLPAVAAVLRNGSAVNARVSFFAKNTAVASIARTGDRTATVRCRAKGSTWVGSGYKGVRDSAKTTVRACSFATFTVVPSEADLANVGDTLTATASMLNDCSQMDTTTVMTWVSRSPAIATVTSTGMRKGRIAAVAPGFTYVVGLLSTFKDSVSVCVDSALTVTVAPTTMTLDPTETGPLVAQVTQCGQSVAGTVTWATRSAPIATVASAGSQSATVTGVAAGTTFIVGTRLGESDSSAVTVNATGGPCTPTPTHICPGDDMVAKVAAQPINTAFTVGAGTIRIPYGSQVSPKAGMSFTGQPYVLGRPSSIIDGGKTLTGWIASGGRWYVTGQTQKNPEWGSGNCEVGYERCLFPEQLWMDGVLKRHEDALADCGAGEWYFEYTDGIDRIYVCDDPTGKLVETSETSTAFRSTAATVTLKRLGVRHFTEAQGQGFAVISAEGTGWTIDSVWACDNNGAGVRIQAVDGKVRYGRYCRNGQYGLTSGRSTTYTGMLIYRNTIDSNCVTGFAQGFGCGATKFVRSTGAIIRRNTVTRNFGNGIWMDIDNINVLIDSNTVTLTDGNGIFCEIGYGCEMAYNTVTGNGVTPNDGSNNGAGLHCSATTDCNFHNNTVSGNEYAVLLWQQSRGSGVNGAHIVTDALIQNNVFTVAAGEGSNGYRGDFELTDLHLTRNNRFELNTWCLPTGTVKYLSFEANTRTDAEWTTAGHDTPGGSIQRGGTCP